MILHVANIDLKPTTGMGRIACAWRDAFERQGYDFVHLNAEKIGYRGHHLGLGRAFRQFIRKQRLKPSLLLVHEPFGGWLHFPGIPLVVFSHGVEERGWKVMQEAGIRPTGLRGKLIPPFIRYYPNRKGFRKAGLVLLSNTTDEAFVHRQCPGAQTMVFRNGYQPVVGASFIRPTTLPPVFLFNATWIPRKGIGILTAAFNRLLPLHPEAGLILAGTGVSVAEILPAFLPGVQRQVKVVPRFTMEEETGLLREAGIFVLPSYFEGQSLALTQAMAAGLCPVVSDNSGQIDLVKHNVNGLLFETGSAESLFKQLEYCLLHREEIFALSQASASSVAPLVWDRVADNVLNLISPLIYTVKN